MVVSELLTESLEELGLVAAGEVATPNNLDFAFRRLNRLCDRMKAEGDLVPFPQTRTTFALGAVPVAAYTVGVGGTVNVARPVRIDGITFYDTSMTEITEFPIYVMTDDEYRAIQMKAVTSPYPTSAYWNPTFGSTGFATLTWYPVPTSGTLVGVLYAPSALAEFTALSDTVSVPPGYREYFVTQIALRLAPGFRREPSQTLLQLAASAKATVQAANLRESTLQFPSGTLRLPRGYGWSAYSDS